MLPVGVRRKYIFFQFSIFQIYRIFTSIYGGVQFIVQSSKLGSYKVTKKVTSRPKIHRLIYDNNAIIRFEITLIRIRRVLKFNKKKFKKHTHNYK